MLRLEIPIVRELLMRQRVRRIIVAAPPSVVLQWKEELDRTPLARRRGQSPTHTDRPSPSRKR